MSNAQQEHDEDEDARLIEDLYNYRVKLQRSEFDFWSILLDKVTNPTKFPGSYEKFQQLTIRDIRQLVNVHRNRLADLLEEKEKAQRNGFRLAYSPEDEDDPLR